jgi:hypothetical protein
MVLTKEDCECWLLRRADELQREHPGWSFLGAFEEAAAEFEEKGICRPEDLKQIYDKYRWCLR